MRLCQLSFFVCLLIVAKSGWTQNDSTKTYALSTHTSSSSKKSRLFKKTEWIIPAVFIVGGSALAIDKNADEFFLNNQEVWEERNEHFVNFSHKIDNYLQYLPDASVLTLSLCGVKGRNDLANQTVILIKSEILVGLIVLPLKQITREGRPDTGERNSFPSGHTAQAFAAATFLAKEYGKKSIWYAVGGYTVATAVGTMRVLNDRHWISDVIVGAGIGILSTNLVYATHQHKWGKHKNTFAFAPAYSQQSMGFYLNYRF